MRNHRDSQLTSIRILVLAILPLFAACGGGDKKEERVVCNPLLAVMTAGLATVSVQPDPPVIEVLAIQSGSGDYLLSFTGVPDFTYTIQFTDSLEPPNWQNLTVVTADGAGAVEVIDGSPGTGPLRVYRAVRGVMP